MAASNEELQTAFEDAVAAAAVGPKRWRNGRMEVERGDVGQSIGVLLKLRGLNSSRRGLNVSRIENAK